MCAVAALALALVAAACTTGSTTGTAAAPTGRTRPTGGAGTTTSTTTTTVPVTTTTSTDPGLLPQTADEPPLGAPLDARMQGLWSAIVAGSPAAAEPLFFPRSAYLQLKTGILADPASDYADRLVAFYDLDLAAYHQLVTAGSADPPLTEVLANPADAAWIGPGQCENRYGYWHLPGVRLVYGQAGGVSSVAVASLISWRGVWYVVHLGPNPRPSNVGTVTLPQSGAGVAGPAGGC